MMPARILWCLFALGGGIIFPTLTNEPARANEARPPKPAAAAPAATSKPAADKARKPAATAPAKTKPAAKPAAAVAPKAAAALAAPVLLSVADQALGREAMREFAKGRFDASREAASRAKNPIIPRLQHWLWLQTPNSGASFDAISQFILSSPDWPAREALLRRADETVNEATGDERVVAWYAQFPPETGLGWLRLSEALERLGRVQEALAAARKAWVEGNLSLRDETDLWHEFGQKFSAADHAARLDRLIWDEQFEAARRMLPRVSSDVRALAEVRLAFALRLPNAERLSEGLPAHLQKDGGLAYEHMRWNRRQGKDDTVEALLLTAPTELGRAEKWWVERHFRARKAMVEGRISEAYRLAAGHGLRGGVSQAEAEALAGWIALRLLQEPANALPHFQTLQNTVRTPVSLARAGYWLGRTHQALGNEAEARRWYAEAARNATSFYGQLAAFALDPGARLQLPLEPEPAADAVRRFEEKEVVRAARVLMELGEEQRLRPFILRLAHTAETPEEHLLSARLARQLNRVDLAVAATKRSARYSGVTLVREAFPLVEPLAQATVPEPALVLAVSRQESEFNQYAISPVGARGLMQLMPATAKGVSREIKVSYSEARLTGDAEYNMRLGTHYLNSLLRNWDGNYILALSAYNAGEGRVRKWIKDWGDPRNESVDPIDWIELIPFSETRNYVQRVLEGVQVYRTQLRGHPPTASRLLADLRGTQRRACAGENC